MTLKIIVQIQIGNTSFSFETDESGLGIEDAISSIEKIIKTHGEALASISPKVPGKQKALASVAISPVSLRDLNIKPQLKDRITTNIRKVSYWDLVLTILYHAATSLTYDDLMSISKEIGKPVSYNWLNTEFHRKKYRGLVRSEKVPGSKEKAYLITELGRRRTESVFERLGSLKDNS